VVHRAKQPVSNIISELSRHCAQVVVAVKSFVTTVKKASEREVETCS
jgi:hypothetical protein